MFTYACDDKRLTILKTIIIMNKLFQTLHNIMSENVDINITIQKSGDKLITSILPKAKDVKDEAAKKIIPLVVSGTPVELDEEFAEAIVSPVQKASGILTGMAEFEASTKDAEKNSKAAKDAQDKAKKKAEADKKKLDQLLKKADELEKDKKYQNAIACLNQALEFATNKASIEKRIKSLEAAVGKDSLFGEMDTEEPVKENYLDEESNVSNASSEDTPEEDSDNDDEEEEDE